MTTMLTQSASLSFDGRPVRCSSSIVASSSKRVTHFLTVFSEVCNFVAMSGRGCLSAARVMIAARPSCDKGEVGAITAGMRVRGIGSESERLMGELKLSGCVLVMSASGRRGAGACGRFEFRVLLPCTRAHAGTKCASRSQHRRVEGNVQERSVVRVRGTFCSYLR